MIVLIRAVLRSPLCRQAALLVVATSLLVVFASSSAGAPGGASAPQAKAPTPQVLAYYYIWFDPSSWNRAKIDYPVLGRYSSDEREVMRQHIRWAKDAGIDGFIVSWKSTEVLNRRLEKLLTVSREEGFKIAMIYQGLDFQRDPLSIDRISADLDLFIDQYAADEALDMFPKPLMIWSGTWQFSREEIEQVVAPRRDRLLLLATEKNVEGYERIADIVDGDAYYWSSVDPETHPGYPEKLQDMGEAIHARGGLWIAPAAPGFNARLLGGNRIVDRKGGETLRREMEAAASVSPDVIGLISWNEFSENTHVEPSQTYGTRSLEVVAEVLGGVAPVAAGVDSSDSSTTGTGYALPLLGGVAALLIGGLMLVLWRRGRAEVESPPSQDRPGQADNRTGA
jgi:hypothetical protein